MFEDEKIDYIESLPEADTILMIWVRLLTIAGKSNVGGYIMLTEKIPYTEEMLAHKFKRQLNTVKFALRTFMQLDMIGLDEFGLKLINWEKHQNIEGLEKIREQNRVRKQRQRLAEKKQLPAAQDNPVPQCHVTVTSDVPPSHVTELELDKELDISTIIVPTLVETDIPNGDNQKKELGELPAKEKYKYSDEHMDLAERLKNLMLENKPNMKTPSSLGQWANTIRLMIERDGREPEQIATVIDWCQKDKFWKLNILSGDTLREKFDRLELQMAESLKSTQGAKKIQSNMQVSAQVAWEEVYTKLIINKQKGVQWSSDFIGQTVKRVGFTNLLQNGEACMAQFVREYNEVTR